MSDFDSDLIAEFVVESQEGLANIEQQLLAIESAGAAQDVELVNGVFRTMHTIKGSAGFLGLDRIGALAHGLEEVLDNMRNREIATSSELVTSILRASDFMKGLIEAIDTSNEADITDYVAELQQYLPHQQAAASQQPAPVEATVAHKIELSPSVREFLSECCEQLDSMDQELLCLEQAPDSPQIVRILFRSMHTVTVGAGLLSLRNLESIAQATERLLTQLRDEANPVSTDAISALMSAVDKCRDIVTAVENGDCEATIAVAAVVERLSQGKKTPIAAESSRPVASVCEQQPEQKTKTAVQEHPVSEKSSSSGSDTTIRVDVGLLDKLMTRVGELVLARNQIVQYTGRLEDATFHSTAQRLNLITTELQESVMKTRMQPIGNVWAKFPRVVRDLAGQLHKEVRIEMEGKDTELDKTIVEAIKDPLTHLIRNSVDHGIESPSVRQAAGKPTEGRLVLRAYHEGGQVNIEISDDGAGLNLERIRKRSIERGLLSADQTARMSDRELSQMIFAAGFSTAEQVTSVSGRGVGMDVVKTNIERIGGIIELQSAPGEGTTVKIKIPLTLAIIPALIVTTEGDRYAIPQINLLELVRLEGTDAQRSIEYMHGAPVYRLRGKLLPLVYLSERLGLVSGDQIRSRQQQVDAAYNIVVLRADDRQFGLIVDKVNDTEEIVVKPLGKQLKKIGEYAGATIMGDGGVALILDVKGLAVASGLSGELRSRSGAEENLETQRHRQSFQSVLLVDVGDARRFALPISMVSRLEKISNSLVELANGREVIQYRGKILPLLRLDEIVGRAATENQSDELQVVVYDQQGHSFGLVVRRILDTCEVAQQANAAEQPTPHLLGTCVIQQRVTDVIDMQEIGRQLRTPSLQTSI
ncbi:chemotaxis protein CheA [Anatilimnocola floriformis]|uniref:chemotaxis protein CheA n=1 Tax=Anatilimnocola floriformis TaxID=2948575 RepID=UPI0020C3E248|nr:chemotaxis protein CheA [Anatilimnocola floriformis]